MGNYPGPIRRPSFPTVISLIALFVALGGTSYAVIKLPAKSVGNRELKSNAVTSAKIRPRSVARSDLAPGARSGARGPRGPAGPPGGPAGSAATEPWQPLRLIGSWRSYGEGYPAAAYRKDALGRVHLRGLVMREGGPVRETLGVLPASHAPAATVLVTAMMGAGTDVAGRVHVIASGEVVWISGPAAGGNYTSLDNIAFWTD